MNAWIPKDQKKKGLAAIGASETNLPISEEFGLTAGGACTLVVAIKASGVTVTNGITAKLQTRVNSNYDWVDSKTASITTNGAVFIKLLSETADDQEFLPLLASARVVISTGVSDAVTIDQLSVIQAL
jgi:hypothetical protein